MDIKCYKSCHEMKTMFIYELEKFCKYHYQHRL